MAGQKKSLGKAPNLLGNAEVKTSASLRAHAKNNDAPKSPIKSPAKSPPKLAIVDELFAKLEKVVRGRPHRLEEDIYRMRLWLTKDRALRPSGYMNQPRAFSAYTAYHLPLHLPEIFWILEQTTKRLGIKAPRSILDMGCGPGTATLSYLLWNALRGDNTIPERIQLFDQSSRALTSAKELVTTLLKTQGKHDEDWAKAAPELQTVRGNLNYPVDRKKFKQSAQWIFLSHVLNEYGNGPRHREKKFQFLCRLVREHLPQSGGLLFIVEPPLREPTMDLMWLRDRIAEDSMRKLKINQESQKDFTQNDDVEEFFGEEDEQDEFFSMPNASVLAPCPAETVHCPMALAKAGWCYAQPPRKDVRALGICPWDREIEDTVRIQWSNPGFSYLVIQAYGNGAPEEEIYGFSPGRHGIALSDESRVPSQVCRNKRVRNEGRTPYRGAYLAAADMGKTPFAPK